MNKELLLKLIGQNGELQIPCVASADKKIFRKGIMMAISQKSRLWQPGDKAVISVTFGEYNCGGCDVEAAWSLVGSESKGKEPSMNLGFIDPPFESFKFQGKEYNYNLFKDETRNYCKAGSIDSCNNGWTPGATVIHEFCHALGMLHEHQNNLFNSNTIDLDQNAVIEYYEGIGMTEEDAVNNVLKRYDCKDINSKNCDYVGSKYDPTSIMLYALPDSWLNKEYFKKHGNPTKPNFVLSATDIEHLRTNYPIDSKGYPELTISYVDSSVPLWKQAWVQKIISENIIPIVNIGFRFINTDGTEKKYIPAGLYKNPDPSSRQKEPTIAINTNKSTNTPGTVGGTRLIEDSSTKTPETTRPEINTNTPETSSPDDSNTGSAFLDSVKRLRNENFGNSNYKESKKMNNIIIAITFIIVIIIIIYLYSLSYDVPSVPSRNIVNNYGYYNKRF